MNHCLHCYEYWMQKYNDPGNKVPLVGVKVIYYLIQLSEPDDEIEEPDYY